MEQYEYTGPTRSLRGKICRVIRYLDTKSGLALVEFLGGEKKKTFLSNLKLLKQKEAEVYIVKEERTERLSSGDNPIYSNYGDALKKAQDVTRKTGKAYLILKAVSRVQREEAPVNVEEL